MNNPVPSIDKAAICALIPHAGSMCLLDNVYSFTKDSLLALSDSHRLSDNPLRSAQGIRSLHGIEYAAQAMAVHGALLDPASQPREGYIASVRGIKLFCQWLPMNESIEIEVEHFQGDEQGFTYQFHIQGSMEKQTIITGKITVFLVKS